jgi:hypothetical protein
VYESHTAWTAGPADWVGVELVETLHDDSDRSLGRVVKPAAQRGVNPVVGRGALGVAHCLIRADRVVEDGGVAAAAHRGRADRGCNHLPAPVWTTEPEHNFLTASYSLDLSTEHSVTRRSLLQSPWFQRLFGDRFQLAGDRNQVAQYANDWGR